MPLEIFKNISIVLGAITGAAAVITLVAKVGKWFLKLQDKIDDIAEHESENYNSTLRLTIMSPYMPMSERLKAGEKYVNRNQNGEVKAKYQQLLKQYERQAYDE